MMDKFATGSSASACQMLEALGIDWKQHPVKEFHVHCTADDIMTVDLVRYVREGEQQRFTEVLEHYKLVPKDE